MNQSRQPKPIVVLTATASREEAERLAGELVSRRLAACVNVLPEVESIYRWQGEIQKESEHLLIVKSVAERYPELERTIRELHSYDVPEVVCLEVARGEEDYLAWLAEMAGVPKA